MGAGRWKDTVWLLSTQRSTVCVYCLSITCHAPVCNMDVQKLIPGSHLSSLVSSAGSLGSLYLCVHLWCVIILPITESGIKMELLMSP